MILTNRQRYTQPHGLSMRTHCYNMGTQGAKLFRNPQFAEDVYEVALA